MRERVIVFGAHRGLVGILTEPEHPAPGPRCAILLANVGMHHRVGPFRLYVELARHAAALGWYALRFDLSGFGDSEPRPAPGDDAAHAVTDMTEAMDWLAARCQVERFVLTGLCSGVDAAHAVTVADARVAGSVFIDGYTYSTLGHRVRHRTVRYLQGERWLRYARRRLRARDERAVAEREPAAVTEEPNGGSATDATPAGSGAAVYVREYPPQAQFRQDVAAVTARGARLLFIYTGSVDTDFNHERQLFEMLGRDMPRDRIDVERFGGADHLFSATRHRAALLSRVAGWLGQC